jgi:hypothetical protein
MGACYRERSFYQFFLDSKTQWEFLLEYLYGYFGKNIITLLIFAGFACLFFRAIKKQADQSLKVLYFIIISWIVLSYGIPLIRSIVSAPILHIRYTIVSLGAWVIIFAIGCDSIKSYKVKNSLLGLFFVASMLHLFFLSIIILRSKSSSFGKPLR